MSDLSKQVAKELSKPTLGMTREELEHIFEPVVAPPPRFYQLLDELRALHDRKAHDYAPGEDRFANLRECEAMGIAAWEGVLVRMLDKMSRLKNLAKKARAGEAAAVTDESMDDTLRDLAVYALICLQLREELI